MQNNENASIGRVGGQPYYDPNNDRVKGFNDKIHYSISEIKNTLCQLLNHFKCGSRFTIRLPLANGLDHQMVRKVSLNTMGVLVVCEAIIPINYNVIGGIAYFGGNDQQRQSNQSVQSAENECLNTALTHRPKSHIISGEYVIECHMPSTVDWDDCDVKALVAIYTQSFSGYLIDFTNQSVRDMLNNNLVAVMRYKGKIVSVVMAEMAELRTNETVLSLAEISEVATKPDFHCRGLASKLYKVVAEKLVNERIDLIFTETRANSVGIMVVAHSAGLRPCGRLEQHCIISSNFTDVTQDSKYGSLIVFYL